MTLQTLERSVMQCLLVCLSLVILTFRASEFSLTKLINNAQKSSNFVLLLSNTGNFEWFWTILKLSSVSDMLDKLNSLACYTGVNLLSPTLWLTLAYILSLITIRALLIHSSISDQLQRSQLQPRLPFFHLQRNI